MHNSKGFFYGLEVLAFLMVFHQHKWRKKQILPVKTPWL